VFKENAHLYPIIMADLLEVGKETAQAIKDALDIAVFYEEDVDAKTKDLSTIIDPVSYILIGSAVGFLLCR